MNTKPAVLAMLLVLAGTAAAQTPVVSYDLTWIALPSHQTFLVVVNDYVQAVVSARFSPPVGTQVFYQGPPGNGVAPVLNANDFQCFLNRFAAGESYANCDSSTAPPMLNANDFQCFLNKFAAGCS
jgi:hypothetical protein